jgi:hypothetical protein
VLKAIAKTLGIPRLPEEWANDQVLRFFQMMWQQWLLKQGRGTIQDDESTKGPAPPAAVAAAAKIALSSLGVSPEDRLRTEPYERPEFERAPVEPAESALLERSESGTVFKPEFDQPLSLYLNDWLNPVTTVSSLSSGLGLTSISSVKSPLDDPSRRTRNLQWVRLNFHELGEIGRLPFNNAALWQLHQFYYSPPSGIGDDTAVDAGNADPALSENIVVLEGTVTDEDDIKQSANDHGLRPSSKIEAREVSAPSAANSHQVRNKRGPLGSGSERSISDEEEHISKKSKSAKPRIAYYPRIKVSVSPCRTTMFYLSSLTRLFNRWL